jgi:hypothetical protein
MSPTQHGKIHSPPGTIIPYRAPLAPHGTSARYRHRTLPCHCDACCVAHQRACGFEPGLGKSRNKRWSSVFARRIAHDYWHVRRRAVNLLCEFCRKA